MTMDAFCSNSSSRHQKYQRRSTNVFFPFYGNKKRQRRCLLYYHSGQVKDIDDDTSSTAFTTDHRPSIINSEERLSLLLKNKKKKNDKTNSTRCESTGSTRTIQKQTPPSSSKKKKTSSFNYYTSDQIQTIKQHVNIVDVIELYADLPQFTKFTSTSAKCICPFHDDTHPSLSIDNSLGIYKCFACGAGGDVLHFLCNYERNDGGGPMPFSEAVQYVINNFCDLDFLKQHNIAVSSDRTLKSSLISKEVVAGQKRTNPSSRSSFTMEEQQQQQQEEQTKKQKLYEIHACATKFYYHHLITSPTAAIARRYLMNRQISPEMVNKFCLGYAPDAFFGQASGSQNSLVQHLKIQGYTPQEMIDSGLVTIMKKKKKRREKDDHRSEAIASTGISTTSTTSARASSTTTETSAILRDEDLIDRFRNRLMIPIWNTNGTHVIGFGGRIVESESSASLDSSFRHSSKTNFTVAKYINSPESLIFHKSNVIFGAPEARNALSVQVEQQPTISQSDDGTRTIILVEGYMDVLGLSNVGINNAVATMGTSISYEQLHQTARLVTSNGTMPGHMVLLLDNDKAGILAIERLIKLGFISRIQNEFDKKKEQQLLSISIASLPQGIKDPDEYVTKKYNIEDENDELVVAQFQKEVLSSGSSSSCDWTLWYLKRLCYSYDKSNNKTTTLATASNKKRIIATTSQNDESSTDNRQEEEERQEGSSTLLPLSKIYEKASDFLSSLPERKHKEVASSFASWIVTSAASTPDPTTRKKNTQNAGEQERQDVHDDNDEAQQQQREQPHSNSMMESVNQIRLEHHLLSLTSQKIRWKEYQETKKTRAYAYDEDDETTKLTPKTRSVSNKSNVSNISHTNDDNNDKKYFGPWPEMANANHRFKNNNQKDSTIRKQRQHLHKALSSTDTFNNRKNDNFDIAQERRRGATTRTTAMSKAANNRSSTQREQQHLKQKQQEEEEDYMHQVPHFAGIQFKNPTDEEWIFGSTRDDSRMQIIGGEPGWKSDMIYDSASMFHPSKLQKSLVLGTGTIRTNYKGRRSNTKNNNHLIYFNSKKYGTKQLLQQYENDGDGDILGFSRFDPTNIIDQAEITILRTIIEYAPARTVMMKLVTEQQQQQQGTLLKEWSKSERQWLFDKLIISQSRQRRTKRPTNNCSTTNDETDDVDDTQQKEGEEVIQLPSSLLDGGTVDQLRDFLRNCPDVPMGAFGNSGITPQRRKNAARSSNTADDSSEPIRSKTNHRQQYDSASNDVPCDDASTDHQDNSNNGSSDVVIDVNDGGMDSSTISNGVVEDIMVPTNCSENNDDNNPQDPSSFQKAHSSWGVIHGGSKDNFTKKNIPSSGTTTSNKKVGDGGGGGTLDFLFEGSMLDDVFQEDYFTSGLHQSHYTKERKAEMLLQESMTTLLKAGATKTYNDAKREWESVTKAWLSAKQHDIDTAAVAENEDHPEQNHSKGKKELAYLESEVERCNFNLREAQINLKELDETARQINVRLLDHSISGGARMGVASVAAEERLAAMVDEYVDSLKDMPPASDETASPNNYIFGLDDVDDTIDERYGSKHN